MKKLLSAVLVFILLLSGCSSDSEEIGGEITVGVFGTPTEISLIEEQAEEFKEETGVDVTVKQYTQFETEIQAELIGGTAPDVFYVDSYYLPFLQQQGVLMPLTDEDVDTSNYDDNLLSAFTIDEELYALPKDFSTLAIYYNEDYVNPEDIPTSYEELEPYLKELSEELPDDVCPMTYNIDLARQMYVAQSGGGSIVDEETGLATLTDPQMADNLSIEFDLAQEGLMCTPQDYGFGWNGEIFGNQKTVIMLEGNWVIGELNNNYSDVNFGTMENLSLNGETDTMMFTVGWGVNASSDNQASALSYIEYMNTDEKQELRYEQGGTLPPSINVIESLELDTDELFGPHIIGSTYATTWQKGTTLETINTEYKNIMPSVASGEETVEEGLERTETEANKIIEANQ